MDTGHRHSKSRRARSAAGSTRQGLHRGASSNKPQWFGRYRSHLIDKSITIGCDFCDWLYKTLCRSCYGGTRGRGGAGCFAPIVKTQATERSLRDKGKPPVMEGRKAAGLERYRDGWATERGDGPGQRKLTGGSFQAPALLGGFLQCGFVLPVGHRAGKFRSCCVRLRCWRCRSPAMPPFQRVGSSCR